jgi:hypothetical protein
VAPAPTPESAAALAALAGLDATAADLPMLTDALARQERLLAPLLEAALEEIDVPPSFDPRWDG